MPRLGTAGNKMSFNYTAEDHLLIIYPEGRLDLNTSHALSRELLELIDSHKKHLIFSFRNIDYLHSSGIRLIITLRNRLLELDKELILCEINESVKKIIDFVDLSGIVKIFPQENEANNYVSSL